MGNDELKLIFAANLNYWLESEGRRQSWLAKKIGVEYSAISRWKAGDTYPRIEHFEKLAEIIGVNPAVLLVPDGIKDPENEVKKLLTEIRRKKR